MIYLDTQSTIWLYEGKKEKFSKQIQELILSYELRVSPMVKLELHYLMERGRIEHTPLKVMNALFLDFGLSVDRVDFAAVLDVAANEIWTRDPFDRIIAAHARKNDAMLITSDRTIRKNYKRAIW